MRRTVFSMLLAVLFVAGMTSAVLARSGATKPSVRYSAAGKARILGSHFKAGERVNLTFRSGAVKFVRVAHASSGGRFTVDLAMLAKVKCTGTIALIAHGAKGDDAAVTIKTTQSCANGGVVPALTTVSTATTTTIPGMNPPPPYTT